MAAIPRNIEETLTLLRQGNYIADRSLATAVFLSLKLKRPLFLEGEAGVGKTEIAKVLSATLGRTLVRLQCYEGLDVASAVYEWDYPRQMLEIRLAEAAHIDSKERISADIFSERFLIKRPLLQALESEASGPKKILPARLPPVSHASATKISWTSSSLPPFRRPRATASVDPRSPCFG